MEKWQVKYANVWKEQIWLFFPPAFFPSSSIQKKIQTVSAGS